MERAFAQEALALPGLVAMELLQGCRNQHEVRVLRRRLACLDLRWPTVVDCQRAVTTFSARHLSHHIGIIDALVAETARGLGAKLATFNARHYRAMSGLECVTPYRRG